MKKFFTIFKGTRRWFPWTIFIKGVSDVGSGFLTVTGAGPSRDLSDTYSSPVSPLPWTVSDRTPESSPWSLEGTEDPWEVGTDGRQTGVDSLATLSLKGCGRIGWDG